MFCQKSHEERSRDSRGHRAPARRTNPARRRIVCVAGGERDYACWATILIHTLQKARALAREAVRRERLVGFLRRGDVDFIERSSEIRTTLLARRTHLQMRAVG